MSIKNLIGLALILLYFTYWIVDTYQKEGWNVLWIFPLSMLVIVGVIYFLDWCFDD